MIVVTGAAGFIGSNIVIDLLAAGHAVSVCDYNAHVCANLKKYKHLIDAFIEPTQLSDFLGKYPGLVKTIIHMGAISSTTERDLKRLLEVNTKLTVDLLMWCALHDVRFIYASSASVYGNGSSFEDSNSPSKIMEMLPLNGYSESKRMADLLITNLVKGDMKPPQWVGLRFFNVYGPNEYHKGDQASIIFKAYGKNTIQLFDTDARRDFVYVKDCSRYVMKFVDTPEVNGIFNIGSGEARSFDDIAKIMGLEIERIPMPEEIKRQYQSFTKSAMSKVTHRNLWFPPTSLEDGIADYTSYLSSGQQYR